MNLLKSLRADVFLAAIFMLHFSPARVAGDICAGPVCEYHLKVSTLRTMVYKDLWRVTLNGTRFQYTNGTNVSQVDPNSFIPADGFERDVVVVNGQFPGPTIEVMEGVQIVVNVTNELKQREITMHWHGMVQLNTNSMDGVGNITQCPISPGQTFTYRFTAQPAGTHFYHSHGDLLRMDGLQGVLIVHRVQPTIPYFAAIVRDWSHVTSDEMLQTMDDLCEFNSTGLTEAQPTADAPVPDCTLDGAEFDPDSYESALFGARGRYLGNMVPLTEYNVQPGQRIRFRLVNGGFFSPFRISVDGHRMSVVASDGHDFRPVDVDAFWFHVAERMDFEIVANQTPGRYWIRADTPCTGIGTLAILSYGDGFNNTGVDPNSSPNACSSSSPCKVFNCPFGQYPPGSNWACLPLTSTGSSMSADDLRRIYGVGDDPARIRTYFFNFGMVAGPTINGRRFAMPLIPLFQPGSLRVSDCVGEPCGGDGCQCRCTNMLSLSYNSTVRFVVSNLQPDSTVEQDLYHTVHLHGYNFAVLSFGYPEYDNVSGHWIRANSDVTCGNDTLCSRPQWMTAPSGLLGTEPPPIKDSFVVPVRGYAVIQFKTLNPGNWLLHCHLDSHMMGGMATLLRVEPERLPPVSQSCYASASTVAPSTPSPTLKASGNSVVYSKFEARLELLMLASCTSVVLVVHNLFADQ